MSQQLSSVRPMVSFELGLSWLGAGQTTSCSRPFPEHIPARSVGVCVAGTERRRRQGLGEYCVHTLCAGPGRAVCVHL